MQRGWIGNRLAIAWAESFAASMQRGRTGSAWGELRWKGASMRTDRKFTAVGRERYKKYTAVVTVFPQIAGKL